MIILQELIFIFGSCIIAFVPIFLHIRAFFAYIITDTKLMGLCRTFILFLVLSNFLLNIDLFSLSLRLGEEAFNFNIFLNYSKVILMAYLVFFICLFFYEPFFDGYIFPFRIYEFFSLLCFQLIGVFSFLSANHIVSCYLTLELQSLAFVLILASNYLSRFSSEASLKYFMLGSFSTALLLLSFVFFYGFFGISNFSSVYYLIGFFYGFFSLD